MGSTLLSEQELNQEKKAIIDEFNRRWRQNPKDPKIKCPVVTMENTNLNIYIHNLPSALGHYHGFVYQLPYALGIICSLPDKEDIEKFLDLIYLQDDYMNFQNIISFLAKYSLKLPECFIKSAIKGIYFLTKVFGKKIVTKVLCLLDDFSLRIYESLVNQKQSNTDDEFLIFSIGCLALYYLNYLLEENPKQIEIFESDNEDFWNDISNLEYTINLSKDEEYKKTLKKYFYPIKKEVQKNIETSYPTRINCSEKVKGISSLFSCLFNLIKDKAEFEKVFLKNNLFFLGFTINRKNEKSLDGEGKAFITGVSLPEIHENKAPVLNTFNCLIRKSFLSYMERFQTFYEKYEEILNSFLRHENDQVMKFVKKICKDSIFCKEENNSNYSMILFENEEIDLENMIIQPKILDEIE